MRKDRPWRSEGEQHLKGIIRKQTTLLPQSCKRLCVFTWHRRWWRCPRAREAGRSERAARPTCQPSPASTALASRTRETRRSTATRLTWKRRLWVSHSHSAPSHIHPADILKALPRMTQHLKCDGLFSSLLVSLQQDCTAPHPSSSRPSLSRLHVTVYMCTIPATFIHYRFTFA